MERRGWDESADVVVVGFGAAGACTAITAADLGARVLVLEKQPAAWHTPSARASGGQVTAVDDVEKALRYFDRCAGGMIPLAVSRAWVERAADLVQWLETVVGVKMTRVIGAEHPEWEGADAVAAYGTAESYPWGEGSTTMATLTADERATLPRGGESLFAALEAATKQRDRVSVLYEHSVTRLIQDESGRVVGVEATSPGGRRCVSARRGVVLTCGGYEYDEDMKRDYLRASPTYFYASPMNTGDGVRMAQAIGADLWHMNSMVGRGIGHFELEGKSYNFSVSVAGGGYVFTDKYGRRFANEHMQAVSRHDFYYELINYDTTRDEYPRVPCYWFFDQRRMKIGPPVSGSAAAGPHRYEWSEDSTDELARGWLHRSNDIEELAAKAGVADPGAAARTIAEYDRTCETKRDPFGRTPESLIPLDQPPYYCMKLWPGGPNTSGGPRRNARAQVLDVYGEPIPGLYEAGELGEAIGALYPANGANISDALCFGRIAAEEAVGVRTA